ncbi:MAG: putative RNA methyltransferase [Candidatus Sericytochromatia bacterium]
MGPTLLFKCPVCGLPLPNQERRYLCEKQHSFDQARSGYVNLLLAQHKQSRQPGDADQMVLSRQRFLDKGYYLSLAQALGQIVGRIAQNKPSEQGFSLLDLGCGEGYYLQQIQQCLPNSDKSWAWAGLDISKPAIHEHAKRRLGVQLAVASAKDLPFFDCQFDLLLSIFAPVYLEEAARVLKDRGCLLMVGPGKNHLQGLMQNIYTEVFEHKGNFTALAESPLFQWGETQEIQQEISVAGTDILDLLTMTPYYWHTPPEQKLRLAEMAELHTPIHFQIQTFFKTKQQDQG